MLSVSAAAFLTWISFHERRVLYLRPKFAINVAFTLALQKIHHYNISINCTFKSERFNNYSA